MVVYDVITVVVAFLVICIPSAQSLRSPYQEGPSWKNCGGAADTLQLDNVLVEPSPPRHGQPMTLQIEGTSQVTVEGATLKIEVFWYKFHVHSETQDICVATSCPLQPGSFQIKHEHDFPSSAPPGQYTMKVTANRGSAQLFCVEVHLGFVSLPRMHAQVSLSQGAPVQLLT